VLRTFLPLPFRTADLHTSFSAAAKKKKKHHSKPAISFSHGLPLIPRPTQQNTKTRPLYSPSSINTTTAVAPDRDTDTSHSLPSLQTPRQATRIAHHEKEYLLEGVLHDADGVVHA
jgi:hypothetical protein